MRHNPSLRPELSRRIADDRLEVANSYVLSFEVERFYKGWRYHWVICSVQNPDELVAWGHAPMRRNPGLTVAGSEVKKLESGSPKGAR